MFFSLKQGPTDWLRISISSSADRRRPALQPTAWPSPREFCTFYVSQTADVVVQDTARRLTDKGPSTDICLRFWHRGWTHSSQYLTWGRGGGGEFCRAWWRQVWGRGVPLGGGPVCKVAERGRRRRREWGGGKMSKGRRETWKLRFLPGTKSPPPPTRGLAESRKMGFEQQDMRLG